MKEVLKEIVEVLEKHGCNIAKDSACIEIRPRGEILFMCKDLNRENIELKIISDALDSISLY